MQLRSLRIPLAPVLAIAGLAAFGRDVHAQQTQANAPPTQLGALAPANIAKPRPKPPFDLTGTWRHSGGQGNNFRFSPPPGAKLTPFAQAHFDAAQKAAKEGKAYHD